MYYNFHFKTIWLEFGPDSSGITLAQTLVTTWPSCTTDYKKSLLTENNTNALICLGTFALLRILFTSADELIVLFSFCSTMRNNELPTSNSEVSLFIFRIDLILIYTIYSFFMEGGK